MKTQPRNETTISPRTRREFLSQVGQGMMAATIGYEVATGLGLSSARAEEAAGALDFGPLDPLVRLMQDTPADKLLPMLAEKLRGGMELRTLVTAGALANARTFGGEDYIGYHTLMALAPAWYMSQETAGAEQALPVLKVLYRNTSQMQSHGGCKSEVMHAVAPAPLPEGKSAGDALQDAMRRKDRNAAEQMFAGLVAGKTEDAFNALLHMVQDHAEVHRVVLPYRAWDLLGVIGKDHAHALLRQSLRYCVAGESWGGNTAYNEPRELLPKLLDEHKLHDRKPGNRRMDDAWVGQFSETIFKSTGQQAAAAAAAALADGISPADIGEAITLAANQLVLRDMGRTPNMEVPGKPLGSVHGDSIGVHASDSANAWRNMARAGNARNCCASLILGAYQMAHDRVERGGDFLNWKPLPIEGHVKGIKAADPEGLLREADGAIRGNLQARAAAIIHRYGELGHDPKGAFDLLRRYATSEDGALHGEKYFRTCTEEFAATRPVYRWRHVVSLARVTASEFGRPAPGIAQARELLKA